METRRNGHWLILALGTLVAVLCLVLWPMDIPTSSILSGTIWHRAIPTPEWFAYLPLVGRHAGASNLPHVTPVSTHTPTATLVPTATPAAVTTPTVPRTYTYRVITAYPHDPDAFTQGLVYEGSIFYEGTGLYRRSTLRKVAVETGQVLQRYDLPNEYFGEGITIVGDELIQLTWRSRVGFVYDKRSFEVLRAFSYPTEGWGITYDGQRLIMSDGSATLYFWDPETLAEVGRVEVRDGDVLVSQLNELEYINGEVFANVWQTDRIARINPHTGQVTGWIDLTGLLPSEDRTGSEDVLNGIAYDRENDRLFVTGKLWPQLFEIELLGESYADRMPRMDGVSRLSQGAGPISIRGHALLVERECDLCQLSCRTGICTKDQ